MKKNVWAAVPMLLLICLVFLRIIYFFWMKMFYGIGDFLSILNPMSLVIPLILAVLALLGAAVPFLGSLNRILAAIALVLALLGGVITLPVGILQLPGCGLIRLFFRMIGDFANCFSSGIWSLIGFGFSVLINVVGIFFYLTVWIAGSQS